MSLGIDVMSGTMSGAMMSGTIGVATKIGGHMMGGASRNVSKVLISLFRLMFTGPSKQFRLSTNGPSINKLSVTIFPFTTVSIQILLGVLL